MTNNDERTAAVVVDELMDAIIDCRRTAREAQRMGDFGQRVDFRPDDAAVEKAFGLLAELKALAE